MPLRWCAAAVFLFVFPACKCSEKPVADSGVLLSRATASSDAAVVLRQPASVSLDASTVAAVAPNPHQRPLPLLDGGAADPNAVLAAYASDCHAVFTLEDPSGVIDARVTECQAHDFEQSCAPDFFHCFEDMIECKDQCSKPCDACAEKCGLGCDTCKQTCADADDKAACVSECAAGRVDCQDSCLAEASDCREKKCNDEMGACYAREKKTVAEKCPQCEALRRCLTEALEHGESGAKDDCLSKFKNHAAECETWCAPWD